VPPESGFVSAVIRQIRQHLLLHGRPWASVEQEANGWLQSQHAPAGRAYNLSALLSAFQRTTSGLPAVWALARSLGLAQWGAVGYGLMTAPHALAAIQLDQRVQSLTPCGLRFMAHAPSSRQPSEEWAVTALGPDEGEGLAFWLFVCGCRQSLLEAVGGVDQRVRRVQLPGAHDAQVADLLHAAGMRVAFSEGAYQEWHLENALVRANPNAHPEVHQAVCQSVAAFSVLSADLDRSGREPLRRAVRAAIRTDLDRGLVPTLHSLAPRLQRMTGDAQVGLRQLQRRLAASELSFREEVAEVRRERALDQLRHSNHTLAQIAAEAGYAELSSFHRAVRRWTGHSPVTYRAQGPAA
jgi:AraC-like DNA-binding protein